MASTDLARPTSSRLVYDPIAIDDLPAIVALHQDPRITTLLVDGVPDTLAKAFRFLDWNRPMAARGFGTFAVRRSGDEALIGLFSLTPFDGDDDLLELGGKLACTAWRGGLAVEAGAAMIAHAFGPLSRDRLVSAFDPAHRAAPASLARLGFVPAGQVSLFDRDVALMELMRAGWEAQGCVPRRSSPSYDREGRSLRSGR
jgi:RimJ/RimL family protein N-acetyltransferase